MIIKPGATDVTVNVYFADIPTIGWDATGNSAPKTGLLFSNIETGGSASYQRQGAARVDFTLVTQTAAGAHTDGGFVLIDDTNMPGLYRLDVPDAAFASGVDFATIHLVAASANNAIMRPVEVSIVDYGTATAVAAIPTTAMRGTDNAALASVATEARLAELDAANLPTDVAAIPTTAMRGTDNAALASVATEARLAELDAANLPASADAILVDTGTTLDTKINDIQGATFSSATDSLEAVRDRGDAAWVTGAGGSDRLLMVDTTIATLATQTSFTLTAGSADNDAYNNCTAVLEDVSTATQKSVGMVLDYVGSTKTVTLKEAPAFTIAATDKIYILAENALKSTVANRQLDVTATGASGIDWANIEGPTTAQNLSATNIDVDQIVASVSGAVGSVTGHTAQTGDTYALANGTAGFVAIDTVVDAILVDTAVIGVAGAGLTAIATQASVNDVPTVAEFNARTLAAAAYFDPAVDAVATVTTVGTTTTNTDMVAAAPTAAAVADAVWDEAQSAHVAVGSFGIIASEIASIPTTAMRGTDNAATATALATVDTVVDGIQTDLSNATDGLGAIKADTAAILVDTAEIGTAGAGLTALSVNVKTINSTPIVGDGSTTPFGV
jgi:hypothetical protein